MNRIVARIKNSYAPAVDRLKKLTYYRHTDYGLILSSTILGIGVGLAIVVFHLAVSYAQDLFERFFLAADSYPLLRYVYFPLIVATGGLVVGVINRVFFRNVKDEGLPSVVEAVKHEGVLIHRRSSLKAILTAAFSIGSGGGAGREAPTILLGASVGSTVGQTLRLRPEQLRILSAAGAAAAISGIFNAPLGGVVFAIETIIGEMTVQAFVPLVISSVMATATCRLVLGDSPLLIAPPAQDVHLPDFVFLAFAGIASGGIALYYLKTYNWCFAKTRKVLAFLPETVRPATGGLAQGILVAFLPTMLETSYDPINLAIAGNGIVLIAALSVLVKPFSTAITLGSGGAGGTFAPALKIGALFGFAFGSILKIFVPATSPGLYALVSTAAVLAGSYRMPLTGAILVFEICRNYNLILPLMFASIFATFVVQRSGIRTFNPLDQLQS